MPPKLPPSPQFSPPPTALEHAEHLSKALTTTGKPGVVRPDPLSYTARHFVTEAEHVLMERDTNAEVLDFIPKLQNLPEREL